MPRNEFHSLFLAGICWAIIPGRADAKEHMCGKPALFYRVFREGTPRFYSCMHLCLIHKAKMEKKGYVIVTEAEYQKIITVKETNKNAAK